MIRLALIFCLAAGSARAWAHDAKVQYLNIVESEVGHFSVEWKVPYDALEKIFDEQLVAESDKLQAIKNRLSYLDTEYRDSLRLNNEAGPCGVLPNEFFAHIQENTAYLAGSFSVTCSQLAQSSLSVEVVRPLEASSPILVSYSSGGLTRSFAGIANHKIKMAYANKSLLIQGARFFQAGILHIWSGLDHVLFLITLILPAVFMLVRGRWIARERFSTALLDIVKTATAFTLAHSITLCLASLGVLHVPPRVVESLIALSVLLAALNNIYPLVGDGRWQVAFLFGLVHGIGFAEVLMGLKLPGGLMAISLLSYNIGVEAGQICIIFAVLPLMYWGRKHLLYKRLVFMGGSCCVACIAAVWLVDRALELGWAPF